MILNLAIALWFGM